eukprot:13939213-Ditylum_brightwellii.AAC.1
MKEAIRQRNVVNLNTNNDDKGTKKQKVLEPSKDMVTNNNLGSIEKDNYGMKEAEIDLTEDEPAGKSNFHNRESKSNKERVTGAMICPGPTA